MSLRDWSFAWDDSRKMFSSEPLHNWASHGADGYTYGALVISDHIAGWGSKLKAIEDRNKPQAELKGAHYTFNLEQLHEMVSEQGILRL